MLGCHLRHWLSLQKNVEKNDLSHIQYCVTIVSLLGQFAHPRVRTDFVNGCFTVESGPRVMEMLDLVRWSLIPRWIGGSINSIDHRTTAATMHLDGLYGGSSNFMRVGDDRKCWGTYKQWSLYLDELTTDSCWRKVLPDDRCTHIASASTLKFELHMSSVNSSDNEP